MALVPSATSKLYSGFGSPLSIPGCFLWLDAADTSTLSLSGSNVLQWNDKSGNGYHASNVGGGYPIFNDVSTGVVFNASQQLRTAAPSSFRTETGFLVTRFRGGSARTSIGASAAGYRSIQFDGSAGYIINRDVLLIASNAATPGNQRFLFSYDCGSTISIDASQVATGVAANFSQGNGVTWIGNDSRGFTYFGDIHEIILYSNILTPTQQQAVEGYLARKWSLTPRFSASHPFKTTDAFLRPFQPLDISGCLLWVDAQDAATYTLSSSNVTAWNDKSGNGYNFGRMSTGPIVSNLNGRPALYIGSGGSLCNATASIPTAYSVFAVANRTSGQDYQYVSKFHRASDGYFFFGTSNSRFATFAGDGATTWWDVNGNTPEVLIGSNAVLLEAVNDGGTITPYTNGVAQDGKTGSTAVATGLTIGSDNNGNQLLNGSVGEFFIYNRPLGASERHMLEGYMAWRWGLVSDLSTSHPFKLVRPMIPVFDPRQVGRCAVWLDADDKSTITMSGSNVSEWRDKSGNGYNFNTAPSGCALPVVGTSINGRATVGITSVSRGIKQTTVIDGLKTVFWVRRETTGNRGYEFYFGADSSADFHTGVSEYAGSGFAQNGVRDASLNIITSSNVVTGTLGSTAVSGGFAINLLRMSGLTGSTRFQGVSYDRGQTGRSMMCDWGELLMYTTTLTPSQITAIEGYLAQKWGIQSYLPTAHPFKVTGP